MYKKAIVILASVMLYNVSFAKTYQPSEKVTLSQEFLSSLNEEQRSYLEEQLNDPEKPSLKDYSDYEFIDMDEIEEITVASIVTSRPTRPNRR